MSYKIVRMYFNGNESTVRKTGLTLEEAQAHCQNPETSSGTCSATTARRIPGKWFDGYEEE